MTHVAFGYELSDDYHLRTKVAAVRGFYFSIAAIAGGWLYWLALQPFFGGEIAGIRWISVGMGIVFAGLAFAIALFLPISQQLMDEVRAQLDARRGVPLPEEPAEGAATS